MPKILGGAPPMSRPEQQIQRAVFQHFRQRAAPGVVAWHCPNGGWRSKAEASILAGQGVKKGVPDVNAVKNGKFYALELKAPGGKLTEAQEQMLIDLRTAGATACHCHGLDEALRILEGWGLLKGKTQ
jgi:hypothetical protein